MHCALVLLSHAHAWSLQRHSMTLLYYTMARLHKAWGTGLRFLRPLWSSCLGLIYEWQKYGRGWWWWCVVRGGISGVALTRLRWVAAYYTIPATQSQPRNADGLFLQSLKPTLKWPVPPSSPALPIPSHISSKPWGTDSGFVWSEGRQPLAGAERYLAGEAGPYLITWRGSELSLS